MNIGEKSKKLLLEETKKSLTKFISLFPEGEGFDPTEEIIEETMNNILINNSRSLYDFFDKHNIIIAIYPSWKYGINDTEYDAEFENRILCEKDAFQKAFNLLEEKL